MGGLAAALCRRVRIHRHIGATTSLTLIKGNDQRHKYNEHVQLIVLVSTRAKACERETVLGRRDWGGPSMGL